MNYQSIKSHKAGPLAFATAVSLFTAILFCITIIISYQYYQKQKFQQLQSELNVITENIRKVMINSNLAAFSVGLTVNPSMDTVIGFDFVAKEIMQRHSYLHGVQLLRKGKIQHVYPESLHQAVIGFDVLKEPVSSIEAQKAIDQREIYYAGPLDFQQGGQGIIGRLPIFHRDEFWGFSAVLITMEDFLISSGITDYNGQNVSFHLSKINPNTGKEEVFTSGQNKNNISLDFTFPEAGWKVTAYYQQDSIIYILLGLIVFLALASSLGSGLYAYQLLKKPEKLERLLSKKTKEIEDNNEYLSSMVQAIPDLIFVYDEHARYLDFHAYQLSLLYYQPKEFIGKSTYELFEKDFAEKIHENIKLALDSKMITEYSYYLDFNSERKYFESRYMAINSEKVLAVIREVTERKLAEQELEKSEQKYRNLVSQASDAIFLADEIGNILELNEKGHEMTGISIEDIRNYNLIDIIKFEHIEGLSLTDLIHKSGTILEETTLVSVNKQEVAIEISCKIIQSHQIQGIVRDITRRNNYIRSIQNQNNKLKEIAWIQSHEVRAPLSRLLGLVDFIDKYDRGRQEDKIKVTNAVRASALELDRIIRDVVRRTEESEIPIS